MVSSRLRLPHALAALAVVSSALVVLPASTAHADDFPGDGYCAPSEYVVPQGVSAVNVVVIGSKGEDGAGSLDGDHGGGAGGQGGKVTARLPVTPGEQLWAAPDCFYGGISTDIGSEGGRGGKGSGIYTSTSTHPWDDKFTWQTLVIAGGGGGGGAGGPVGPGGTGGAVQASGNDAGGSGGGGATATSGGTGGGGCDGQATDGDVWTVLSSGNGGFCSDGSGGNGGGGGGGYYRGGGGGGGDHGGAGGGGGSDYVDPSATNVVESVATEDAGVSITPVAYATTLTLRSNRVPYAFDGSNVDYSALVTGSPHPTGTVTFQAQLTSGGPTIAMGSASIDPISNRADVAYILPAGIWTVTASYSGDALNLPSSAPPITQQIGLPPSVIVENPTSTTVALGDTATFKAESGGADPPATATWQESLDSGASWFFAGAGVPQPSGEWTFDVHAVNLFAQNGSLYRAVFSNAVGSLTTKSASLGVDGGAFVLSQPASTGGLDGTTVAFRSEAGGNPLPNATWQMSSDGGGTWTNVGAAGDPTFTVTNTVDTALSTVSLLSFRSTSALSGRQFRVQWGNTVNGSTFTVTSETAAFTWEPMPSCIVLNPTASNFAHCAGVHFDGQFLEGLPGQYGDFSGASFSNADLTDAVFGSATPGSGANLTGADLSGVNATLADFQTADLTGANLTGADFTSTTVIGATFTHTLVLPADVTLYEDGPVLASTVWGAPLGSVPGLTATCGYTASEVQWNDGPNTVPCTVGTDVENQGGGTFTVTLVPLAAPQVSTQPSDATATFAPAPGSYSAQFSAAASGSPPPTVQWQVSTDNGATFGDVPDATSPTLTVDDPPISADGTQYRAVFTNSQGSATSNPATLHVQPMTILAVITGQQPYGGTPTFTSTVVNPPAGVTASGTVTCSSVTAPDPSSPGHAVILPINTALPAGSYQITAGTCGGLTLSDTTDYLLEYGTSDFTVLPVIVTVNVSGNLTIPGALTFTETDNAPAGILPTPFTVGCTTLSDGTAIDPTLQDGTYTVLGSSCASPPPTNPNYAFSYRGVAGGFTVQHLVAEVTVGGFQAYGSTTPTFTETDNTTALGVPPLGGTLTCKDVASPTLAVGPYPLPGSSCGGLTSPIVPIDYEDGEFQVFPAPIDVTADDQSMAYGGSLPAFTFQVTGLVNKESASVLGITCSAPTAGTVPAVGTYPIVCDNPTDLNYAIVGFTHGTLTVTKASLSVTANDQSMTYGGTVPTPLTATISGFVNGETLETSGVTGAADCTTTATSASAPGGYPITCTVGSLSSANYDVADATFVAGTLTVSKPSLTVTADNSSMTYGGTVPTPLTATISGFVDDDTTTTATSGAADCTTTATSASPAGTYPITCTLGTLTASDYSLPAGNFVAGTMTVGKATLTVTADDTSMTYGASSLPTFTSKTTGFVNGDPATVVGGSAVCSTTASTSSAVSTYPITCDVSGMSAANYSFTPAAGTLTVTKAPLTVTADNQSMLYGGTVPSGSQLTATLSGFVNGDMAGVVSGAAACSTTATSSSPVGPYAITCTVGTLTASNYDFPTADVVAGTLTVKPEPVTVTAKPASMTYGGPLPATYDATASGLISPDTFASLGGTCGSTTASLTLGAGTYPGAVTCSGITSANYAPTYYPATLTVNQAVLTVTADDTSMTYGATALPSFTATTTGFVNHDPASVVSGSPICTTTATLTSPAGPYPITCDTSHMSATNYTFTAVDGTLTVGRHPATVGYTGGMFFATSSSTSSSVDVPMQGLVVPATGGTVDLTKAGVTFDLFKSGNVNMDVASPDASCNATVSATGTATCTVPNLGTDNWTVIPVINGGNGYFTAYDGDPVIVTVYQPTTDSFVTGGGWVKDTSQTVSPANQHGNFGFNVHVSGSSVKGQSVFSFRGADGYDYVVKSNSWQSGGASIGATTGSFAGKCSVIVVDPATGLVVTGLGGGNYSYRVDATDGGTRSVDTYAISVYTPQGVLWHQAGTASVQLPLGGGNLVVHGTKK